MGRWRTNFSLPYLISKCVMSASCKMSNLLKWHPAASYRRPGYTYKSIHIYVYHWMFGRSNGGWWGPCRENIYINLYEKRRYAHYKYIYIYTCSARGQKNDTCMYEYGWLNLSKHVFFYWNLLNRSLSGFTYNIVSDSLTKIDKWADVHHIF